MTTRRERPFRRTNPSGKQVWVARWTDRHGKRRHGMKPDIPGTFDKRGPCKVQGRGDCCAQHAIEECYKRDEAAPVNPGLVGGYFEGWLDLHPRSRVTDRTLHNRVKAVLDVPVDGVQLRDWQFDRLRRRHAQVLVAAMLIDQGRAVSGVKGVLSALSCMAEDAIDDEVAVVNPFRGVKVRANDPRVRKQSRPVRVFTWEQMYAFARACAAPSGGRRPGTDAHRAVVAEPMVRVLSDCGLRVAEMLAMHRADMDLELGTFRVWRTLTENGIELGTKTDKLKGVTDPEKMGRVVPIPPGLCGMLAVMPRRIDTKLLFPAPMGKPWGYPQWFVDVWQPAQKRTGLDIRPHEMRHSQISLLRAAGIDPADLAAVSGHSVMTATRSYTHSTGRSHDAIREAVGQ